VLDNISNGFNKIAVGLENMAKSNPQLLKFATYALGALMIIGPLGIMSGGAASAFGALAGVLGLVAGGLRAVTAASGAGLVASFLGMGRGAIYCRQSQRHDELVSRPLEHLRCGGRLATARCHCGCSKGTA